MTFGDDSSSRRIVFLTGANGFVGSHLARTMIERGYHVRALIRPKADRSRLDGLDVEWVVGDLDNHHALTQGASGAQYVIHNAGRVRAPDEAAYHHANCVGTIKLLDAVEEAAPQIQRIVYVSSQAAGGPSTDGRPKTEDDANIPHTAYGRSKLEGENAVMARSARLPVVTIRPPAVYGPEDTAILAMFQTVKWHLKPLFGSHPQQLSIVHVSDLVHGITLAIENDAANGHVFFVAEDQHYSLAELLGHIQKAIGTWALTITIPKWLLMTIAGTGDVVGKAFGFVPRLNRDKARDFLQPNWTCSTAKASRLLGYHSQIPFSAGAKSTADWYRKKGWL